MRAEVKGFGEIRIEGRDYAYDVVIEAGRVRKRKKKPSKAHREAFGHTPLSADEKIPWGGKRLIVGTGIHGALPVMREVYDEAERRSIEVVAVPTPEACRMLVDLKPKRVFAVLHTTC